MPGVPRELAEHSLHVRSDAKPVKQPVRRFTEEKRKAIGEEIAWLLATGFIMEVFYRLVSEPSPGPKEEQYLAHVYRLHEPQQGLPQGSLRVTTHRSGDRFHSRLRPAVIS
jgi:hypothetical protein